LLPGYCTNCWWKFHQIHTLSAAGNKDELITFSDQKVKGQGQSEIYKQRHTDRQFAVKDHAVYSIMPHAMNKVPVHQLHRDIHTNGANHKKNDTGEFLELLVNACCQVVDAYALVTAACCYDITAHNISIIIIVLVLLANILLQLQVDFNANTNIGFCLTGLVPDLITGDLPVVSTGK